MQVHIPLEGEDSFRLACVQLAQNYYDQVGEAPNTIDEWLEDAAKIEFYVTNGQTLNVNVGDALRKVVR